MPSVPNWRGPVHEAFERYARLQKERQTGNSINKENDLEIWQAIIDVLNAYRSKENGALTGSYIEPFPAEVAGILERTIASILAGYMPESFQAGIGAPSTHPLEKIDQSNAVLYVTAAKEGLIADKHPVKTVCAKFGVAASTYRRWAKLYPVSLKAWNIDWGPQQRAAIITERMKFSADRYHTSGRSQRSILDRAETADTNTEGANDVSKDAPDPKAEAQRLKELTDFVNEFWEGPTTSPADGTVYTRKEEYLNHLIERGLWPATDPSGWPKTE